MSTVCVICQNDLDFEKDTYVTFSRASAGGVSCKHFSHLTCSSAKQRISCPSCSSVCTDIDFGLNETDARFSAVSAMKFQTKSVEKGIISSWMGRNTPNVIQKCLSKYPEETLLQTSLLQFIEEGITVQTLLKYLTPVQLSKKLSCNDILQLSPSSQDIATLLVDGVFDFTADDLSGVCHSIQDLTALNLSPSTYIRKGFTLDEWITRGAALPDILSLHDDDVRFSEFVATWKPSMPHLVCLKCFDIEYINKYTKWNEGTVRSYAASRQREVVQTSRALFPSEIIEKQQATSRRAIRLAF